MRMNRSAATAAFTLVELIIVITVLGILAAMVIPKLSSATDVARSNGAFSQITSVRKQMEVWKLDHADNLPTLAQLQAGASDWESFTGKTTQAGDVDAVGRLGPYFPTPPMNPFTNSTLVVEAGSPVITAGWTYDQNTGILKLVLPAGIETSTLELGANDYEQISDE